MEFGWQQQAAKTA